MANSVLLIDDNPDCNFIMREFIRMMDPSIAVTQCQSARDGMDELEAPVHFPDVIYVDINMPITDGFTFVDWYEKHVMDAHPDTKIYMLSSSVRRDDMDKALEYSSVAGFISKSDIEHNLRQSLSLTLAERA